MNNKIRILLTKILLHLVMNNPLCTSRIRRFALVVCGAKIGRDTFIGQNVYFDPLAIQNISVGEHCYITQNVSILTHFYGADRKFYFGKVEIGDNVFIGTIVTHDIPENVLACGVPCRVIKKLN